jgi:hypothetical protein
MRLNFIAYCTALWLAGTTLRAGELQHVATEEGQKINQIFVQSRMANKQKKYAESLAGHRDVFTRKVSPEVLADIAEIRLSASYNVACELALLGKKDEALKALAQSVEFGHDNAEHIQQDADLITLRAGPAFKKIVDRAAELQVKNDKKWVGQVMQLPHGDRLGLLLPGDDKMPAMILILFAPPGSVAVELSTLAAKKANVEVTGSGGDYVTRTVITVTRVKPQN